MSETYWLSVNHSDWEQVSKRQYVAAERAAGYRNTAEDNDEPATRDFHGRGIEGRTTLNHMAET